METPIELLLRFQKKDVRWEDEEKANDDVEVLRQEFNKRLYREQEFYRRVVPTLFLPKSEIDYQI